MTTNQYAPARTGPSVSAEAPPAMGDDDPILTPEDLLHALAGLRTTIEQTLARLHSDAPATHGPNPSVDTDALLQAIGDLRTAFERTLTPEDRAALPQRPAAAEPARYLYAAIHEQEAIEDFAFESALETVELLAEQAHAVVERKMEQAYRTALRIYYAMEDALANDPENREMLAHMENMQRAHQSQYGTPIPPRDTED